MPKRSRRTADEADAEAWLLAAQQEYDGAEDEEFEAGLKAFNHVKHATAAGVSAFKYCGALDSLYWSLWALGGRQRLRVPHPVRLAEAVQAGLLDSKQRRVTVAAALKRLGRERACAMGARTSWIVGNGHASKSPSPWRRKGGSNAMLRYLRARWLEGCCWVAQLEATAVDWASAKARGRVLTWLFVGRDACARHQAFAAPTARAIAAILGAGGGVVELGAGNGYWAKVLALAATASSSSSSSSIRALDVVPPPDWRQPREVEVQHGLAEDLQSAKERTLLLCMPSPGEDSLSDAALDAFRGTRVAYVGEWESGMTATLRFHQVLAKQFVHVCSVPLPCMPLTRIALHVFSRGKGAPPASSSRATAATASSSSKCAACARPLRLHACPWTRSYLVCSRSCYGASEAAHSAALAATYCGAATMPRPPFESFEQCVFLEAGKATDTQWLKLATATPQPERDGLSEHQTAM